MTLDHAMERIGKIIAADNATEVVCRGVDAYCTNSKQIVIPSVETYEWLGADAETMLHGLLDHETGHARDSDFEFVKKADARGHAFKALFNALEDGYVEMRQGNRYRGCAQNLARKNEWFWKSGAGKDKTPISEMIRTTPDLWGNFIRCVSLVVRPFGGRTVADIEPLNPAIGAMLSMTESEWRKIGLLKDEAHASGKVYAIAERIFAMCQEAASKAEPEKSSLPEDGALEQTSVPSSESVEAPSTKEEIELPELDLAVWKPGTQILNPEEAIAHKLHARFDSPRTTQPYTVFDHSFDLMRDFSSEDLSKQSHPFELAERSTRFVADALTLAFEAGLRARAARRLVSGHDEGEIDEHMLPEYAVGTASADTMYKQSVADDDRTVAVAVLVDCSGSMTDKKSILAQQAALAMCRALGAAGIACEVTGFTCASSDSVLRHDWINDDQERIRAADANFRAMRAAMLEAHARGTNVAGFAREFVYGASDPAHEALQVPMHAVFKSFASDDARGLMWIDGIHNNLDGEAVLWQARRLAARAEQRRVMFVLSDGQPAGSCDSGQGARYLKEVVGRVQAAGIEVYGIGICSPAVKDYYPLWWVVQNLNDLVSVAVTSLTEVLVDNRTEQQCVTL